MSRMMLSDNHVMADINITPFTDVLLVLLVIFMILAALGAPPGFQKQYERPPNNVLNGPRALRQIEVDVSSRGAISIDGAKTSESRLYPAMSAAVRAHTHRAGYTAHVALTAANAAPYAVIIRILDAARQAGDNDVGFVTY
jgi:biopolymer transport protein ExbD